MGALVGWFARLPKRAVASIMAFGGGVLISALSFELMDESVKRGGLAAAGVGFITGVVLYSVANVLLAHHGAKHRKRSGGQQPSESEQEGSGTALLVGALIDGIPESIAIGVSTIQGGAVGWVTVLAVFLSNIPKGPRAPREREGRPQRALHADRVDGGGARLRRCLGAGRRPGFRQAPDALTAGVTAVAAGRILAMVADTTIPEAFSETHNWAGLMTALGFLLSFFLSHLSG